MGELLRIINEWIAGFEKDFERLQSDLNRQLRAVETSLLRRIIADILPALSVTDGEIKSGVGNMAKVNLVERIFDEIGRDEVNKVLAQYADALLAISGKNAEYYFAIGFDNEKVRAIADDLTLIRGLIGIDADGKLKQDGFLYRLGRSEQVREDIKAYMLTAISSRQSLDKMQRGLGGIIKGANNVDGALVSYWKSYAYDTYSRIREVDNLHFKDEIGLRHFMYQGGLIKTSRYFCIKKNGKVFSEEEAKRDWPNDPDLIDQKHKAQYNPLIDRGRNNCRHFLMWITEERYNDLK